MLLEQTTAMLSLTILKKILEKINLQKCLQREVFIKFFYTLSSFQGGWPSNPKLNYRMENHPAFIPTNVENCFAIL